MSAMLKRPTRGPATVVLAALLVLAGCAQPAPSAPAQPLLPAEPAAVDPRAQLVFAFSATNEELPSARVLVDGLDVGSLGQFERGRGALRVSAGTHRISVSYFGRVLHEEQVTVVDGDRRTLRMR
jgi:hypothetical protein